MGISREQELNHWCSQGLHQLRKLAEEKVCNLSCVNFALASCLVTVNMSAKKICTEDCRAQAHSQEINSLAEQSQQFSKAGGKR